MPLGHITSTINTVTFLNNIAVDKDLNLFYECAIECIHLCRPGRRVHLFFRRCQFYLLSYVDAILVACGYIQINFKFLGMIDK